MIESLEDKLPLKIWLDTGTHEEGWERARKLRDLLVEKGWRLDDDLQYHEIEGGDHSEGAWAARVDPFCGSCFQRRRHREKTGEISARVRLNSLGDSSAAALYDRRSNTKYTYAKVRQSEPPLQKRAHRGSGGLGGSGSGGGVGVGLGGGGLVVGILGTLVFGEIAQPAEFFVALRQ